MSGPGPQSSPPGPRGGAKDTSPPESSQVVDVEVLERHYQIRCDRPELISWISQVVNDQAMAIRQRSPSSALSDLDVMVQVAFRLAVSLYQGRRDLEALKESCQKAEARVESLAQAIEKLLPPL